MTAFEYAALAALWSISAGIWGFYPHRTGMAVWACLGSVAFSVGALLCFLLVTAGRIAP